MRKIFSVILVFSCLVVASAARADDVLARDTSDPLYLQSIEEILSNTTLSFSDSVLRVGQSVSYGFNNQYSIKSNTRKSDCGYEVSFGNHWFLRSTMFSFFLAIIYTSIK